MLNRGWSNSQDAVETHCCRNCEVLKDYRWAGTVNDGVIRNAAAIAMIDVGFKTLGVTFVAQRQDQYQRIGSTRRIRQRPFRTLRVHPLPSRLSFVSKETILLKD